MLLDVKLHVNGEEIEINEFVEKVLSGIILGVVNSLHGIKKDWKEIKIVLTK